VKREASRITAACLLRSGCHAINNVKTLTLTTGQSKSSETMSNFHLPVAKNDDSY